MKKALLYLLLFSYTTIICKPILPALSDCIAHIFWYSDHMATVHYEHGKYHVHYELQEAAKNNYPAKDASLPKSSVFITEHLNAIACYDFSLPAISQNYYTVNTVYLPLIHLNNDFPPPKV